MHLADMHDDTTTVVVDGDQGYDLQLHAGRLEVHREHQPAQRLPLHRIGQVILRNPANPALQALLQLLEHGATIQIQNGLGDLKASLVSSSLTPDADTRALTHLIEGTHNHSRYREWRALMLRHLASLILRTAPRGPIEYFEHRLRQYASRDIPKDLFNPVWDEVQGLQYALIDDFLTRNALRRLTEVLTLQRLPLQTDLCRCTSLPLLWRLAPWLREQRWFGPRTAMQFFHPERRRMHDHLHAAIAALRYHLRRGREDDDAHA